MTASPTRSWCSSRRDEEPVPTQPARGHEPTFFFRPLAGRDTEEFFGDSRYGEFWVGARPTLEDMESELGDRTPGTSMS